MSKSRLEAFSDGVLAIIITIMVLELKVPHSPALADLIPLFPVILSYVLSFIYAGIYWNNHHHLFQAVHFIKGSVLWANLHLLFWLSLVPFVTAYAGENHFSEIPVSLYGFVLLMSGTAYSILVKSLIATHPKDSALAKAVGSDCKGKISLLLYAAAIPLAFFAPIISCFIYVAVAAIWFIPDTRIEKMLSLKGLE